MSLIEASHPPLFEAPDGWEWITLGEVGVWTGGGTPRKGVPEYWDDGTVPWISPKDMKQPVIADSADHITEDAAASTSAKLRPAHSVAFVTRSGILEHSLPVAYVPVEASYNQDMKVLTPGPEVDAKFVAAYCRAYAHEMLGACRKDGTTVASLDLGRIRAFPFPKPPLDEQIAIVKASDVLVGRIDASVTSGVKAVRLIERFDASLAHRLFTGESPLLSKSARTELVNAAYAPLAELATTQYGYTAAATVEATGTQMLRITDIQDGRVDWSSVPWCEIRADDLSRYRLIAGDLLFARTGATTGKHYLVREDPDQTVFASYLIRVRAGDSVLPEFLDCYFGSPAYWSHIARNSRGTGQPNVNASILGSLPVPDISPEAQTEVVDIYERMTAGVRRVRDEAARPIERSAEALRLAAVRAAVSKRPHLPS